MPLKRALREHGVRNWSCKCARAPIQYTQGHTSYSICRYILQRPVRPPTFPGMTRPTIKSITYRAPRRIEEEDRTMRKAELHREIERATGWTRCSESRSPQKTQDETRSKGSEVDYYQLRRRDCEISPCIGLSLSNYLADKKRVGAMGVVILSCQEHAKSENFITSTSSRKRRKPIMSVAFPPADSKTDSSISVCGSGRWMDTKKSMRNYGWMICSTLSLLHSAIHPAASSESRRRLA